MLSWLPRVSGAMAYAMAHGVWAAGRACDKAGRTRGVVCVRNQKWDTEAGMGVHALRLAVQPTPAIACTMLHKPW